MGQKAGLSYAMTLFCLGTKMDMDSGLIYWQAITPPHPALVEVQSLPFWSQPGSQLKETRTMHWRCLFARSAERLLPVVWPVLMHFMETFVVVHGFVMGTVCSGEI